MIPGHCNPLLNNSGTNQNFLKINELFSFLNGFYVAKWKQKPSPAPSLYLSRSLSRIVALFFFFVNCPVPGQWRKRGETGFKFYRHNLLIINLLFGVSLCKIFAFSFSFAFALYKFFVKIVPAFSCLKMQQIVAFRQTKNQ